MPLEYHYFNGNPNFSVVLPGGCNASCAFCFWSYKQSPANWLQLLRENLRILPKEFTQCSITGGEPALSPILLQAMDLIRPRFEKVVITTNGTIDPGPKLMKVLQQVDYVNISRHSWDNITNNHYLGLRSSSALTLERLHEVICEINKPVNINCVFSKRTVVRHMNEMVRYMREIEATSLTFRQESNKNSLLPYHNVWEFIEYHKLTPETTISGCPVCLTLSTQPKWDNFRVSFKTSITEPSILVDPGAIYELIMQQNGDITTDWAGKNKIILREFKVATGKNGKYLSEVEMLKKLLAEAIAREEEAKKKPHVFHGTTTPRKPAMARTIAETLSRGSGCGARSGGSC